MNQKILFAGLVIAVVLFAGCTRTPSTTAPTVSSEGVESASSSAEIATGDFVNQSTPTDDQTVPNLS